MPAKKKTTAVRKTTAPVATSVKPSKSDKSAMSSVTPSPVVIKSIETKPAEIKAVEIKAVETKSVEKALEIKPAVAAPVAAVVIEEKAVSAAAAAPAIAPEITEAIAHLRHPVAERAAEAAERLAASGDAAALMPLIAALRNDDGYSHVVVRAAAAMALGRFNDSHAIIALTVAAADSAVEVSTEAILSLGQLRATDATDLLIDIADNASGYYLTVTRHAAIRALGMIGATRAKGLLSDIAGSQNEPYSIATAASDALTMM